MTEIVPITASLAIGGARPRSIRAPLSAFASWGFPTCAGVRLGSPRTGVDEDTRTEGKTMYPSATLSRRVRTAAIATAAVAGLALVPAGAAMAAPAAAGCDARTNNTYEKLLGCVTVDGVLEHEEALQAIADANGGTRAAGTTGYTESVDYVVDTLEAAGWNVELDEFDFTFVPPPLLEQLTPVAAEYESGHLHGNRLRRGHGQRDPGRHRARPAARPGHQRLRGGGLRRDRLVGRQRHRAHPARHVRVRRQGDQRPDGRRRGRHHLQPGQHASCARASSPAPCSASTRRR